MSLFVPAMMLVVPVKTLTFVVSAKANSSSITIPSLAAAGDLGVLCDWASNSPSLTIPSGWTQIRDSAAASSRLTISYKVLVAGEPNSSITGMGATDPNKIIFVFRPDKSISNVTPSTWAIEVTAGNPASQNVAASGKAVPMVVIGAMGVTTGDSAFTTASPAFTATLQTDSTDFIAGYKIYNSSPADHTVDAGDVSTNGLTSGYIICQ
jgi:hypothetical protein